MHQPVEEDTQAFGGREETAVEEVELVVILHQELQPGFVAARGAHRLRGWERRHVGEKRGGKQEGKRGFTELHVLASPWGRNSTRVTRSIASDQYNHRMRSIVDEMLCSNRMQPPGTGSAVGKTGGAPIGCWGTQIQSQAPGSCSGGDAHLN